MRYAAVLLLAGCGAEVAPAADPAADPAAPTRVEAGPKLKIRDVEDRPPARSDIDRAFREVDQSPDPKPDTRPDPGPGGK